MVDLKKYFLLFVLLLVLWPICYVYHLSVTNRTPMRDLLLSIARVPTVKSFANGSHFNFKPVEAANEETVNGPVIIYSTLYFEKSKFYKNDTALIQFRAKFNLSTSQRWQCRSKNSNNEELVSETFPRFAYLANTACYFHTFLADCTTVSNPTSIRLNLAGSNLSVQLPIQYPVREHLPVVSCVGSTFFAERWQQALVSIEMYASLGVDRQVYYFVNGAEHVYLLLKEYERAKLVDIRYWPVPDIDEVNARHELYGRDQIGSTNDCYQLYREAADFIIVHDVDDVLLLENGRDYHSYFSSVFSENPYSSHLYFSSYAAELVAPDSLHEFNFESTLKAAKIDGFKNLGKSVYDTTRVETVWVHKPHFVKPGHFEMQMPLKTGFFFHMRKWTLKGTTDRDDITFNFGWKNQEYPAIDKILAKNRLDDLIATASRRIKKFIQNPKLFNLTSTQHYYNQIDVCVKKYSGPFAEIDGCRTPYNCHVDPVLGFQCIESVQSFSKHFLDDNFIVFLPESGAQPRKLHNGCRV